MHLLRVRLYFVFIPYQDHLRGHSKTTWTEFCHFLYSERRQKQTFFDPSPPHLVHVVIKWPLGI